MTDHDSIRPGRKRPDLADTAAAVTPPRLTRRGLLSLGLALAGSGLLPALKALAQVGNPATDPMLAAVADPAAAASLGRAYLGAYPAEADAEQLHGLLRRTLFADLPTTVEGGDTVCQRLAQIIGDDYINGEVIDLDGWQISRGEARLYALAALSSPSIA